ncbi:GOLPH3/VPS74 family protein [Parafrankia discariae]|uniref:GOLPH3/VPS74 family protein n=1 Tax=Parafrankia discariae TaxID=365528 RepID=UPI00036D6FB0|nr:GPP34 family phosphoprotein [Parafrankia discariae]
MRPPTSLPAQLYLLAYDLERDRMYRSPYLGRALRAAAATELYQGGLLTDDNGRVKPAESRPGRQPHPGGHPAHPGRRPDPTADELCAQLIGEIGASSRHRSWKHWVNKNQRTAGRVVRDQLEAGRWIRVERRRILGMIPATSVTVRDRAMVRRLHREMEQILHGGPAGRAEPGPASLVALLAAGEIGAMKSRRARRALKGRLALLEPVAGPAVPALRAAVREAQTAESAGAAG